MPLMSNEPIVFMAASLAALDGQYVLLLVGAVGLMYRNWRADEAARREENKEANRAVTAGLEVLKDEKHGERLDRVAEKLAAVEKLDTHYAEFREFRRLVLERFDSIDRHLNAQPQPLQRIVPTMPEDEPRAAG